MRKNCEMAWPDESRPVGIARYEIKPFILGGDTPDPLNETWLTRQQHLRELRDKLRRKIELIRPDFQVGAGILQVATIGILLVALTITPLAKSMEHQVGGKAVNEVFNDARLAELASAACHGNAAAVAQSIKGGTDPNGKGFEDVTPLYWAVSCQNLRGIEALLRAGANPNYMFGKQFSAVYAASTMKEPAVLKLLLKYGGDPNTKDNKSAVTALERALSLGIHGAGWDNYYALLQAGADINRADRTGDTIAKAAGAFGHFDKVAELLERGYNYDLTDLGRTVQARRIDPNSDQAPWQSKVKAMLEKKGVQFPIAPKAMP